MSTTTTATPDEEPDKPHLRLNASDARPAPQEGQRAAIPLYLVPKDVACFTGTSNYAEMLANFTRIVAVPLPSALLAARFLVLKSRPR